MMVFRMSEPDRAGGAVQSNTIALRYEALLQVSESIAVHRDLPALFHDLRQRLPQVVNFDVVWLALHDPAQNTMRVHTLETDIHTHLDFVDRALDETPS